jgi:hypothetical protein
MVPSAEATYVEIRQQLAKQSCIKIGIPTIDHLAGCLPGGAISEIYGDFDLILHASYIAVASLHCRGGAALGIVQDNQMTYDLYAVRTFLRIMGCSEDGLLISRAFKIEDAVEMIKEAISIPAENLVIFDPYVHSPLQPKEYWRLTPLTAALRKAIVSGKRIVLLNRVTKFGRFLPEGGKMHHHAISVIIKLERNGKKSYRAFLVKHPSKPEASASGSIRELYEVSREWGGQYLLLEWL